MKEPPRKRRTREHRIADLSINYVERQALLCGFLVERITHDYGIDLEMVTFNRKGEIEEGKVFLQVKASDRVRMVGNGASLAFRVERSDLVSWLAQPMPVVLVVYDARRDKACWLYVQSYFRTLKDFNLFAAGQSITVQIPARNALDVSAMRRFRRFRDRILEQFRSVIHDEG
jgi:hypothetical protein